MAGGRGRPGTEHLPQLSVPEAPEGGEKEKKEKTLVFAHRI